MVRILLLAALTLICGRPESARADAPAPIDVVFDLDWTLVSPVDAGYPEEPRVVVAEGKRYRIADGAEEVLNLLRAHPHVRVSFFSGGAASRNEALLKLVVLRESPRLTAFDVAYRILSFEDLGRREPPRDGGKTFADRLEKRLAGRFPDLSRTVVIDDNVGFAAAGEERNFLGLGATYDHYATYADAEAARAGGLASTYLPPNAAAWELDRLRIPVHGLLVDAAIRAEAASADEFLALIAEKSSNKAEFLAEARVRTAAPRLRCPSLLRFANAK